MGWSSDIFETLKQLVELNAKVEHLTQSTARLESRINDFIERLAKVEVQYKTLRESLKNEILADIKADFIGTMARIEAHFEDLQTGNLRKDLESRESFQPSSVVDREA